MDLSEYRKLFQNNKNMISMIKITGGEPTLRSDLADIIISASRNGGVKFVTIFTNGTRRDNLIDALEEIIKSCAIKINIQLSIDGDAILHDEIRGKNGAFREVTGTMMALSDIKKKYHHRILRLSAATCILRENGHKLHHIVDITNNYGFEHIVTFPRSNRSHVFGIEEDWKSTNIPPDYRYWSVDEMIELFAAVEKLIWSGEKISLFQKTNKVILRTMIAMLQKHSALFSCYSGKADLTVFANGDVSRCEMLKSVFNLRDYNYNIKELVQSKQYRDYLHDTNSCWCLHDCSIGLSMIYEPCLFSMLFQ
jgi:MoaA/NifB/PqqE/SkfB family radical SAM enzyme